MVMRPAKKNVSIEIRLPDATKTAFMDRCRRDGLTASEAIRAFIDGERSARTHAEKNRGSVRMGLAAMVGIAFGAVAAPAIAHSLPEPAIACSDRSR